MRSAIRETLLGGTTKYLGPGDWLMGPAKVFWGLRAFSRASIGKPVVQLTRASDSATRDFVTLRSGLVDVAGITAFLQGTTGTVSKLYEQTGRGSAFDLIQRSSDALPTWVTADTLTGKPCLRFLAASNQNLATSGTDTFAQPFIIAGTSLFSGSADSVLFEATDSGATNRVSQGAHSTAANKAYLYAGSASAEVSTTDSALHSVFIFTNGASSNMLVDDIFTGISPGTNAISSSNYRLGASGAIGSSPANPWSGDFKDIGIWTGTGAYVGEAKRHHYNARFFWGY